MSNYRAGLMGEIGIGLHQWDNGPPGSDDEEDEMDDQDAEATEEPTAEVARRLSDLFRQHGRPNWLAVQIPDGLVVAGPPVIPIPEPQTAVERLARLTPESSNIEIVRALVATAPGREFRQCDCGAYRLARVGGGWAAGCPACDTIEGLQAQVVACSSPTYLDGELLIPGETVEWHLRRLLMTYLGLGVDQHSEPAFCPNWYDGCHCLAARIAELEAENERLRERNQQAEDLLLEYVKQDDCEYAPGAALNEGCDLDCLRCRAASLIVPSFRVVVGDDDTCSVCGGHHSGLREGRCPACREGRQP